MGTKSQVQHSLNNLLSRIGIKKDNLEETSSNILTYIGEQRDPSFLGYGQYAEVLWLKGNRKRVLKLTTDPADAYASQIIKDKPSKYLIKVFDVFKIFPEVDRLFGIVSEKLMEPAGLELIQYNNLFEVLHKKPYHYLLAKHGLSQQVIQIVIDDFEKIDLQNVDYKPEGWGNLREIKYVPLMERFGIELETLKQWGKALQDRKIIFRDLHIGNVRFRDRKAILVDLGHGKVPKQSIPVFS